MQRQAADDLKRLVTNALVEADVTYEGAQSFATPRRLALHIVGLPEAQPHRREERKGPRVGAPEGAIQGFLKSAGLARIEDAKIEKDAKKGEFYVAVIDKPGRPTRELLAEILPAIVRAFPWPKSMRWGAASTRPDALRWVRPLRSILCTFGVPHDAVETIAFTVDGLAAGDTTYGHRFMAPQAIKVRRFDDYAAALPRPRSCSTPTGASAIILGRRAQPRARPRARARRGRGALGGSRRPRRMAGRADGRIRSGVPRNPARRSSARRSAPTRSASCCATHSGKLANKFILVANLVASDGGKAIAAGNGRVVRARLADARHFWLTDLAPLPDYKDRAEKPLDQRLEKLKALGIVFHEKLGTQGERIERIAALARELAPNVGANAGLAERAARLAKADLVTEMVGEFPELQGLMGRYYATAQGEEPSVADAIEEHYKPQGPNDRIPTSPVSIAVALADKLDTLAGFWAIDEKPTGSKDPYALRRAALGVIRIVLENGLRLRLERELERLFAELEDLALTVRHRAAARGAYVVIPAQDVEQMRAARLLRTVDLLAFFADRLKVYLREKGARYDLIDAVFALPGQDDLLVIVRRVEALGRFLDTEDGKNLLVGYRRAANIVAAEEKKDGKGAFAGAHDRERSRTAGGNRARRRARRGGRGGARARRARGFRGRDARAREAYARRSTPSSSTSPSTSTTPSCASTACACSASCARRFTRSRTFPRSRAERPFPPLRGKVSREA